MKARPSKISHVSDTALWVATYRAIESERSDALFKDPYARKLAGTRGFEIAKRMPHPKVMEFILTMRTIGIDRLILKCIKEGVDTVINIGAGLDSRPYRMELPHSLNWFEVDFPDMIQYKSEILKADKPRCQLERFGADLSKHSERLQILSELASKGHRILVITEGVIPYLSQQSAKELSEDLLKFESIRFWIQDYRAGGVRQWSSRKIKALLKDSPIIFDAPNWLEFFESHGWKINETIFASTISREFRRPFPFVFPWGLLMKFMPRKKRIAWSQRSGYVLFERY